MSALYSLPYDSHLHIGAVPLFTVERLKSLVSTFTTLKASLAHRAPKDTPLETLIVHKVLAKSPHFDCQHNLEGEYLSVAVRPHPPGVVSIGRDGVWVNGYPLHVGDFSVDDLNETQIVSMQAARDAASKHGMPIFASWEAVQDFAWSELTLSANKLHAEVTAIARELESRKIRFKKNRKL